MQLRAASSMRVVAEMDRTVLRRCGCGAPHPLAMKPPRPAGECPICNAPSAAPETQTVSAAVTGLHGVVARMLLAIGAFLSTLARKAP